MCKIKSIVLGSKIKSGNKRTGRWTNRADYSAFPADAVGNWRKTKRFRYRTPRIRARYCIKTHPKLPKIHSMYFAILRYYKMSVMVTRPQVLSPRLSLYITAKCIGTNSQVAAVTRDSRVSHGTLGGCEYITRHHNNATHRLHSLLRFTKDAPG